MDDQTRHKFFSDGVYKLADNNQNKQTHSVECQSEMRAREEKESEGGCGGALGWEWGEQGAGLYFLTPDSQGWGSHEDTWESAPAAV